MAVKQQSVGLAEMISSLRKELETAQLFADDSKIRFEVEKVDLELQVNIEKTSEIGGGTGVKFWIVNAELGDKDTEKKVTTQSIKLSLIAKDLADIDDTGKARKANICG